MTTLFAYANRQSVRAGESIEFKVSCDLPQYQCDIVRLKSPQAGTGPHVPPFSEQIMETPVSGSHPGRVHELQVGSWILVDPFHTPRPMREFTITACVMPTLLGNRERSILCVYDSERTPAIELFVDEACSLCIEVASSRVRIPTPLRAWRWTFVGVCIDLAGGRAHLWQRAVRTFHFDTTPDDAIDAAIPTIRSLEPLACSISARMVRSNGRGGWLTSRHFNGRIERPRIFDRVLTIEQRRASFESGAAGAAPIESLADWDFSRDICSDRICDVSGNDHHGVALNLPTRAVQGSNWSGSIYDWRSAPQEYGAIHFHDDDLADVEWPTSLTLPVPKQWSSGCYAARLSVANRTVFYVPFFVRPASREAARRAVLVLPTMTYAAYGNAQFRTGGKELFPHEQIQGRLVVLDETELLLNAHPELGLSCYDVHRDGSPVCYATMRRPLASNFRPTGRLYKFCQDLLIVAWLEKIGVEYDVLTDEDIHREGLDALSTYSVVLTGSHPEYASRTMMDSLTSYLQGGGRLMYLGGNGFYWKASYLDDWPGTIELRRCDPLYGKSFIGEQFTSSTGEPGGTWNFLSERGHALVGVQLIAQGSDRCEGYHLHASSDTARTAFILDGLESRVIGDFGVLAGGAAGYEIDRISRDEGSPQHAVVIASSAGHSNVYDLTAGLPRTLIETARRQPDTARADMVFFETSNGGAVWSAGSIAWSGSLSHNRYDNDVARLTENVLRRFLDPRSFEH